MNESYRYNIIENYAFSILSAIKFYFMFDTGRRGGGSYSTKNINSYFKRCTLLQNFKLQNPQQFNLQLYKKDDHSSSFTSLIALILFVSLL